MKSESFNGNSISNTSEVHIMFQSGGAPYCEFVPKKTVHSGYVVAAVADGGYPECVPRFVSEGSTVEESIIEEPYSIES